MTIVVTWYRESFDEVWCIADSRVSSGGKTFTDHAPKIFQLPVITYRSVEDDWVPDQQTSFGFAYAGSSVAATSAYILLSSCTQNLAHWATPPVPPPSLLEIAKLAKTVAEHCVEDIVVRRHENHEAYFFEAQIFGYCPAKDGFAGYKLVPLVRNGTFEMEIQEMALIAGKYYAMGNGEPDLSSKITEHAKQNRKGAGVLLAFEEVLKEQRTEGVGGFPQCASARRIGGVRLRPIIDSRLADGVTKLCGLTVTGGAPMVKDHLIGGISYDPFVD